MSLFGKGKKTGKIDVSDIPLDDFDSGMDSSIGEVDAGTNPEAKKANSRNPVLNVALGVKSGIVDTATSGSFIRDKLQKALPKEASYSFEAIDATTGGIRKIYDKTTKDLRPHVKDLAKKIDRLVPEESRGIKKITAGISNFFSDGEYSYNGPSKSEMEDNTIAGVLGQVFAAQNEADMAFRARDQAGEAVEKALAAKRHDESMSVSSGMSKNLARIATYTDTINQAWQKKSLELQYRQLFVQTDIFKNLEKYNEIFRNQNEAIAKNTALPEFVKLETNERFKEALRNKVLDSVMGKGFLTGSVKIIESTLERVGRTVQNKVDMAKMAIEGSASAADMVATQLDIEKQMESMGGVEGQATGISGLVSSMMGSWLTNWIGDEAAKKIKEDIDNSDQPSDGKKAKLGKNFKTRLFRVLEKAIDINSFARDIEDNDDMKAESETGHGWKKWTSKIALATAKFFKQERPDVTLTTYNGSARELNESAVFDNRTYRTINEVIPGYLARMTYELQIANHGGYSDTLHGPKPEKPLVPTPTAMASYNEQMKKWKELNSKDNIDKSASYEFSNIKGLKYNYKTGSFETAERKDSILSNIIEKNTSSDFNKSYVDSVAVSVYGDEYLNRPEQEKVKIRNMLIATVLTSGESISPHRLASSRMFSDENIAKLGIDKDTRDDFIRNVSYYGAEDLEGDTSIKAAGRNVYRTAVDKARRSFQNPTDFVNKFIAEYGKESAVRLGLVRTNPETGTTDIDTERVSEMMFKSGGAIDDKTTNINSSANYLTNTESILNNQRENLLKTLSGAIGQARDRTGSSSLADRVTNGASKANARMNKNMQKLKELNPEQMQYFAKNYGNSDSKMKNMTEEELDAAIADTKDKVTSDRNVKTNISKEKSAGFLDKLKNIPVFSWMYKSTAKAAKNEGGDQQKVGPMAQDVNAELGEDAAPGGKSIDLTTLNGLNMGAIKELDDKVNELSDRSREVKILSRILKYTIMQTHYMKAGILQGIPASELSALKLRSMGATIDSKKYSSLIGGTFKNVIDLGFLGASDLWTGTGKVIKFGANNIVTPIAKGMRKGYDAIKDPAARAVVWGSEKLVEGAGKLYDGVKDMTTDKIPRFTKWAGGKMATAGKWVTRNLFLDDLYVKAMDGTLKLALQARILQAGGYYDEKSKEVIKTMSDIRGNIVDAHGNLVLSVAEFKEGFYNKYGGKVKEIAANIWDKTKKVASALRTGVTKLVNGAWNFISGQLKPDSFLAKVIGGLGNVFGGALGFGWNKKIYNALLDIRDIIRKDMPAFKLRSDNDEDEVNKKDRMQRILKKKAQRELERIRKKVESYTVDKAKEQVEDRFNRVQNYVAKATGFGGGSASKMMTKFPTTSSEITELLSRIKDGAVVAIYSGTIDKTAIQDLMTTVANSTKETLVERDGLLILAKHEKNINLIKNLRQAVETKDRLIEQAKDKSKQKVLNVLGANPVFKAGSKLVGAIRRMVGKAIIKAPTTLEDFDKQAEQIKAGAYVRIPEADFKFMTAEYYTNKIKAKTGIELILKEGNIISINNPTVDQAKDIAKEKIKEATKDIKAGGKLKGIWSSLKAKLSKDKKENNKEGDDASNTPTDKKGIFSKAWGGVKKLFQGRKGDMDKDGKADGSVDEMYEAKDRYKKEIDADKGVITTDHSSKQRGAKEGSGILGGIVGLLGSIVGNTLGVVGKVLTMLPGFGKIFQGLGKFSGLGKIVGKLGTTKIAGDVAAMTAGRGVISAAGAIVGGLFSWPVMGTALVGGTVWAMYGSDIKKWLRQDTRLMHMRYAQYGFEDNGVDNNYFNQLGDLESYMLDGRITKTGNGEFQFRNNSIDTNELLDLLKIDRTSATETNNFAHWFRQRFRPFFLMHIKAMDAAGVKRFGEIKDLPEVARHQFLDTAMFVAGPYGEAVSPFPNKPRCDNTLEYVKKLREIVQAYWKESFVGKILTNLGFNSEIKELEEAKKRAQNKQDKVKSQADLRKELNDNITNRAKYNVDLKTNYATGDEVDGVPKEGDVDPEHDMYKEGYQGKTGIIGNRNAAYQTTKGLRKMGGQLLTYEKGEDISKYISGKVNRVLELNPEVLKLFVGMAKEYFLLTGKKIQVNSARRTSAEQKALGGEGKGTSLHEMGLAIDIQTSDANLLEKLGLMRKYGFTRPVGAEPWHIEPAGVQQYIFQLQAAVKSGKPYDEFSLSQFVKNSPGKGGGGWGITPGAKKRTRNTEVAMSIIKSNSAKMINDVDVTKPETLKNNKTLISIVNDYNKDADAIHAINNSSEPNKTPMSASKVDMASLIEKTSKISGLDPKIAVALASSESQLTNVKNPISSADGIFQVTQGNVKNLLDKPYRKVLEDNGYDFSKSHTDPSNNSIMANVLLKEGLMFVKKNYPNIDIEDPAIVKMVHMLGNNPTARAFYKAVNDGKYDTRVDALLGTKEVMSNRNVFMVNNRIKTVGEVLQYYKANMADHLSRTSSYLTTPRVTDTESLQVKTKQAQKALDDKTTLSQSNNNPMVKPVAYKPGSAVDPNSPMETFATIAEVLQDSNKVHHEQLVVMLETKELLKILANKLDPDNASKAAKAAQEQAAKGVPTAPTIKRSAPIISAPRTTMV